ncbi:hypothetical protein BDR22DRAFT_908273, partial [Usnea florida]
WGRAALDGTLVHLFQALRGPKEYILPQSGCRLRTKVTGIYWPIDYLLDVLIVFFWEAVDGSHLMTSAMGIYFLGQLFAILVAFYIDCFRQGHGLGSRLIRPTLWLLSFQVYALGCTGFVWALAYTTSSPTTLDARSLSALRSASLVSPLMTLFVLPALCFGYVLPAVLMALPSRKIVTNNFQQMALVSWNLFPLLVFGILKFLGILVPVFSRWRSDRPASSPQEHIRLVRLVSFASLVVSTAIHIAVITVSISSVLFPTLFDAEHLGDLSPASIFLRPVSIRRGDTVGDGVRSFFLWDQASGYPIMMIVMILQLRTAATSRGTSTSWVKLFGFAVLISCIAGPGSACLAISWLKDETLFCYDEVTSRKHKQRIS